VIALLALFAVCSAAAAATVGADPLWVIGTVAAVSAVGWIAAGLTADARKRPRHAHSALPPAPPQLPAEDAQYGTSWARKATSEQSSAARR
jgi:hypothetical protein